MNSDSLMEADDGDASRLCSQHKFGRWLGHWSQGLEWLPICWVVVWKVAGTLEPRSGVASYMLGLLFGRWLRHWSQGLEWLPICWVVVWKVAERLESRSGVASYMLGCCLEGG